MYVCVCVSAFSNISSETTGLSEAKFHVELPWDGVTKVCSNGLCHMTQMVTMPICDKNLKKTSSLELKGWWSWNLVCSIRCSSTTKFVQWWSWVDLDLFFGKVKFGPLCFCMEKKVKQWIFQKLLLSMMSKLVHDYMNLYEYQCQGHSLTLVQGHSDFNILFFFFFRNHEAD